MAEMCDLYTCDVCLEDMCDRDPRMLSCLHSFCMDCLKQLMKESAIVCPTCREITSISHNNIKQLKPHFILKKFKAHMDQVFSSKSVICQLCSSANAILKCRECSQHMCENCSNKHNEIKTFKDHTIYKLCLKHKEGMITHVCMKCAQHACAKCVITEHFNHQNHIEPLQEGTEKLHIELTEYESNLNETINYVNKLRTEGMEKIENITKAIDQVESIHQYHINKAEEARKILDILKESKSNGEKINNTHKEKVNKMIQIKTILEHRSVEFRNGSLDGYKEFKDVKNRTGMLLSEGKAEGRFNPPELKITDPRSATKMINLISCNYNQDGFVEQPILLKTVTCGGNQEWQRPYNISRVDDDCVIISDWNKSHMTCAYISDKAPVTIPTQHGGVTDVCVFQNILYTAHTDCVTKRTFTDGTAGTEVTLLPGRHIMDIPVRSVQAVNDSCIFLLSHSENRVIEFNPNNQTFKTVVSNLPGPIYISMIQRDNDRLYAVSCHGTHNVHVYDDTWRLLSILGGPGEGDGQFRCPWGTTSTTNGIFVADTNNHRVCLFSFEGKFISHILTSKDGIHHPVGLTYTRPYLWVTQCKPAAVKCFKICV